MENWGLRVRVLHRKSELESPITNCFLCFFPNRGEPNERSVGMDFCVSAIKSRFHFSLEIPLMTLLNALGSLFCLFRAAHKTPALAVRFVCIFLLRGDQ